MHVAIRTDQRLAPRRASPPTCRVKSPRMEKLATTRSVPAALAANGAKPSAAIKERRRIMSS